MRQATPSSRPQVIADIHIGRVYDQRDPEGEIHYETFGRLADFFGRNTPVHRHYCFFQVHVLTKGAIHLNLDGRGYRGRAPVLIFTPPTAPHSFYSDDDTDGHVLTVRQEAVRRWQQQTPGQWPDGLLREPAFLELETLVGAWRPEFDALVRVVELLQIEYFAENAGRAAALQALGQCFFIHLSRLMAMQAPDGAARAERAPDMTLFLQFCDMVEAHFRDHLTLGEYARRLSVTEARLNDICRRMADQPPKEIVHERILQEARRLLRYTAVPIGEICFQLGFADPAYFSRFFTRRTGRSPSHFRAGAAG